MSLFQPIFTTFNWMVWSFGGVLWLLYWSVIIVAIITFIGWINVRFFPNTNVEFSKILQTEEIKFKYNRHWKRHSNSSPSHYNQNINSDRSGAPTPKRKQNKNNNPEIHIPPDNLLELQFKPSSRFNKRALRHHRESSNDYRETPAPQSSSSSDGNRSISMTPMSIHNRTASNHLTLPLLDESSFKLTPRIREKRKMKNNINNIPNSPQLPKRSVLRTNSEINSSIDNNQIQQNSSNDIISPSQSIAIINTKDNDDDNELDRDYDEFIKQQITEENIVINSKLEFKKENIKSFENMYTFIDQLACNKKNIDAAIKSEIKQFIKSNTMKLKSFERCLLLQKLMDVQ